MSAKVLVVANRTAESAELLAALSERAEQGACEFTLLVPATPHGLAWAADMHSGERGGGGAIARDSLNAPPRRGASNVTGRSVGDPDPTRGAR